MIKLFRGFSPINIVWLIVVLVLLRVCYFAQLPASVIVLRPFTGLVPAGFYQSVTPFLDCILSMVCVFAQAMLINMLVNKYNLLGKSTFLPALMYIVATSLFTPFFTFSASLVCNFWIIWMLYRLLSFYKSDDAKSTSYDLGMIVALGTLTYLPFTYFFLAIWGALVLFRPFNWREWVTALLGYLTIFFFFAVFYYLNDKFSALYQIWAPLATRFDISIKYNIYNFLLLVPTALILLLCFFKLRENFFKSYVQVRKSFQLLFFMFVVGVLSFYVRKDFRLVHFLLCCVPGSVFFAYYFLHAKKRWFYETLFILLLAGIIYFQFNTF